MQKIGLTVQSGSFAGMKLVEAAHPLGPKLLGTHELELRSVINAIAHNDVQHLVNIGAAEGYYAVGLLRRLPRARATAFELEPSHHRSMESLAHQNDVGERLTIHGACDPEGLASVLRSDERTVLLVDVEGAERELLDLHRVPALRHAAILVEVHDFVDPHISALLRRRFESTHRLTVWRSRLRQRADLPFVSGVGIRTLLRLASEGRPTIMEWFWLEPRVN